MVSSAVAQKKRFVCINFPLLFLLWPFRCRILNCRAPVFFLALNESPVALRRGFFYFCHWVRRRLGPLNNLAAVLRNKGPILLLWQRVGTAAMSAKVSWATWTVAGNLGLWHAKARFKPFHPPAASVLAQGCWRWYWHDVTTSKRPFSCNPRCLGPLFCIGALKHGNRAHSIRNDFLESFQRHI